MRVVLTSEDKAMLDGKYGKATKKAMEIIVTLGEIYGAERLIPVSSVQIAGVSYHNLGEAGLEYLLEMAEDGQTRVLTTLNPAGMDMDEWKKHGISEEFAVNQQRVVDAFAQMGVVTTCTCTPYLIGNLPHYGEHIAWAESSAVCFANSVIGALTNREGGPSALASALTGKTAEYGLHLQKNREAEVHYEIRAPLHSTDGFGLLGQIIGERTGKAIPLISGIQTATTEQLKSFCASVATYGGVPLFHMEGITPNRTTEPERKEVVTEDNLIAARKALDDEDAEIDFISIGCPHASIKEIAKVAELLKGKKVAEGKTVWITTARPTKDLAIKMGYYDVIEESGAFLVSDACCAVAPLKGRFKGLMTDSAKACFYARGKNKFRTEIRTLDECIEKAIA
ncbi:MAG: aconitase X catalytic domain-containing protein [Candidatus Thorarchaeota archaeon]|nr:MAG: aconitase X catalytic domain-containing protein [Candidatus Thorarchaeota archaeon]